MINPLKMAEVMSRIGQPPRHARTPSETIYREGRVRVLHYLPTTESVLPVPVLVVSSLVNKYYILDLMPGRSYVEYLTAQGFGVYLLDWGVPEDADRTQTLEAHVERILDGAVAQVMQHAGATKVSLVGYCMGGTLALLYAALHPSRAKNLVLLATPVDFHNDSLLSVWAQPAYFNVDKFIDAYGNAPVDVLQNAFLMLKPAKAMNRYAELLAHADDEEFVETFLAFDYWANDAVPLPGETFRQFVKDTYQQNLLVRGEMRLGGRRVDLRKIKCPLLNVVAEHDHVVPLAASLPVMELVAGDDKELLKIKGGHHGLSIGPGALKVVWPRTAEWLRARSGRRKRRAN